MGRGSLLQRRLPETEIQSSKPTRSPAMTENLFPVTVSGVMDRVQAFNPVSYASTRNYIHGGVSRLSPYISRGFLSLRMLGRQIVEQHGHHAPEKFLQELAWREYFLRVWEARGDEIFSDMRPGLYTPRHHELPSAILKAQTGIEAIDDGLKLFYETGYLHNHLRMYIASVCCQMGLAHWSTPSRWMYYHLLDGDPASNALSWQWVAGTFSSKRYYCTQDNINKYTKSKQKGSFLDQSYENLTVAPVPEPLLATENPRWQTTLPDTTAPGSDEPLTLLVYNSFNLDPHWHADLEAERVFLLEPHHFETHPVHPVVLAFMNQLADTIPQLHRHAGSFESLAKRYPRARIIYRKHPTTTHYRGQGENPDYLFPDVSGFYPSFSAYWKKARPHLKNLL